MSTDIQLSIEFGGSVLQKTVAAYDFLQTEHKKRDLNSKATERYVEGLIEHFGEVKVLGINRPVQLLSLYLEKISARAGPNVEELVELFDFDRRVFGKRSKPKTVKISMTSFPSGQLSLVQLFKPCLNRKQKGVTQNCVTP